MRVETMAGTAIAVPRQGYNIISPRQKQERLSDLFAAGGLRRGHTFHPEAVNKNCNEE